MKYDLSLYPKRLRAFRDAEGLKQSEISERIGFSEQYYAVVENGIKPPSLNFALAACRGFERPLAAFLTEEEPMKTASPDSHDFVMGLSERSAKQLAALLDAMANDESFNE